MIYMINKLYSEAPDSGGGGGGQPPLLEKSRRGKTIFLPLHLTHYAGWLSYSWVFLNTYFTDFYWFYGIKAQKFGFKSIFYQ